MSVSKLFSLFALVATTSLSVAACAANTDEPQSDEPASESSEADLSIAKITACEADADCVAVPQGGCCNNGYLAAVNKHHTRAYANSVECKTNPRPFCPQFLVHDTRIAQCNEKVGKCEMVQPKDCRTTGCGTGSTCQICWASYACVPKGALC